MDSKAIFAFFSKHKKTVFIVAVIGLVVYLLSNGGPRKKITEEIVKGKGTVTTEDRLKADVEALRKEMELMKKGQGDATKKEEANKEKKPDLAGPAKEAPKPESLKELERILKPQQKPLGGPITPLPGGAPGAGGVPAEMQAVPFKKPEPPRLLKIDVSDSGTAKAQTVSKKVEPNRDLFLPPGSFASFTLTSQAFAPETGPMMPVSAVLDKAFVGPNRSAVPLRGCFFVGKAQGNTGKGVADIKPVKLSCVWPDGESFEAEIAGYVADMRGGFGLPGDTNRHAGTFFSTVGITSFIEGIAQGMGRAQEAQQLGTSPYGVQTATNITGSAAQYGAFRGASDFATASKQFFGKQIENLVPSVDVPAGTQGYVYITSGVRITGGMNAQASNKGYYDSLNLSRSVK